MSQPPALPLAIVGAGPAGLSTALFLASLDPALGRRLVVLEKARFPRDKICAGAIGLRGDAALARIGVTVDVPSAPIRGIGVTTSTRRVVTYGSGTSGRVVRRLEFDAELARVARTRGIAILEGCAVRHVERTPSGPLELSLASGEVLRAEVVVGADGVGGVVRRDLGFDRGDIVAQVVELDTTFGPRDTPDDVIHFDLSDRALRGYGWDFPTPLGGGIQVCRGVYALRDAPRRPPIDERAVRRTPPGARPLGPTKRFSERAFVPTASLAQPRALLVGEAGGIDPVLGEGIAQAILTGEVAARYLAPRLARGELGFHDHGPFLARSQVGRDLTRRAASLDYIYGSGRVLLERWVVTNELVARAGLAYFAGQLTRERLPWRAASWRRPVRDGRP